MMRNFSESTDRPESIASSNAAAPATCGAAMLVPELLA